MGVRAINYCVNAQDNTFKALQIIVGKEGDASSEVALRKHGGEGGACRQWRLEAGDYIRNVQYTWNRSRETVTQVVFQTHTGQTRVFGRGDGTKVNFEYNSFQPFVGLISYEIYDETVGIGAYEDDCVNTPAKLPFGFQDFNVPSMSEVNGSSAVTSLVWVNEEQGISTTEAKLLDQVEAEEADADSSITAISQKEHVANVEFEENVDV